MVLAKSKKAVGLGNSLMNDRFGKGKGADRKKVTSAGIHRINHATGETYVTNERKEASWVKMRSVTEQAALDEFLSTAELAGTDFTAEKMSNVKIIHTDQKNPYLLSAAEERAAVGKQKEHSDKLTVPRRPHWDASTTAEQLDRAEREALLEWRRGLAELQEHNDLLLTPFERNLEVWRQLWRVIERSDLIVQIVDARNPLLFRSIDLERYVKDVDPKKENLLLVNKADMMTLAQRQAWADHFESKKIAYKFFSAHLAKEINEARLEEEDQSESESDDEEEAELRNKAKGLNLKDEEGSDEEDDDERTHILTTEELEELFLRHLPASTGDATDETRKTQIGLVGYPNVGKSSTINALIGAKKVSVSATPGKTKHFQTIHLSEKVILCDCPGLVFPNFATTKAELVCNGILPIDQLREFTGPAGLVTKRIPQHFLEALYGIKIVTRPLEEGGTGIPTAEEMLSAYAKARGFTRTGQGQPDESRAARYVLKDYVSGKILFCMPPPGDIDPYEFNRELYDDGNLPEKRRLALHAMSSDDHDDVQSLADSTISGYETGPKTTKMDGAFFGQGQGNNAHLRMPFAHKYTEQGTASGKLLSGRKQRTMAALEKDVDPKDAKLLTNRGWGLWGEKMGIPIIAQPFVSERAKKTLDIVKKFVEERCIPVDAVFHSQIPVGETRWDSYPTIIDDLKAEARELGLWNLFLAKGHYKESPGFTNLEYGLMAEYLGRSRTASEACNCAAPDTGNMEVLAKYGNEAQKKEWLEPLMAGKIRSAFLMTEPDIASSDATNIQMKMERDGDHYVLNGSKWWSSGAGDPRCQIYIVMAKSDPTNKDKYRQQSVILVPATAKGITIHRMLSVYGYDDAPHGHAHITFENVRVPVSQIVLGPGRGFEIIQGRLGPGRIHHAMRSIGAAENALDWMLMRINDPKKTPFGKQLKEHGVIMEWVARSRIEIDAARLIVLNAAIQIDAGGAKSALREIAEAKVLVPNMALAVIDRAVQSFGAAGVCQDTPLANSWAGIRTLKLADGPDEVHLAQLGKNENKRNKEVIALITRQRETSAKLFEKYNVKHVQPGPTKSKM
ncbi:hypothetical protein V490_02882 [Pseudogymnoascus sp. VKM F-3557]|nr:hypothetical protein V490_02882 [Pseudogymnoascus sp. VKM F-3557]